MQIRSVLGLIKYRISMVKHWFRSKKIKNSCSQCGVRDIDCVEVFSDNPKITHLCKICATRGWNLGIVLFFVITIPLIILTVITGVLISVYY